MTWTSRSDWVLMFPKSQGTKSKQTYLTSNQKGTNRNLKLSQVLLPYHSPQNEIRSWVRPKVHPSRRLSLRSMNEIRTHSYWEFDFVFLVWKTVIRIMITVCTERICTCGSLGNTIIPILVEFGMKMKCLGVHRIPNSTVTYTLNPWSPHGATVLPAYVYVLPIFQVLLLPDHEQPTRSLSLPLPDLPQLRTSDYATRPGHSANEKNHITNVIP